MKQWGGVRQTARFNHEMYNVVHEHRPHQGVTDRLSVKTDTTFLSLALVSSVTLKQVHTTLLRRHQRRLDRRCTLLSDAGRPKRPSILWIALTSNHGRPGVRLRHQLLHLRDHQVCGGQELVRGHHQQDRTAAHHCIFCWVSTVCVCVCNFLSTRSGFSCKKKALKFVFLKCMFNYKRHFFTHS